VTIKADVDLVKAALLYADEVELVSMGGGHDWGGRKPY
jgi:hypothetical protein